MTIQSYRDLTIWQDGITLAVSVYKITADFPKAELYGLTSQLRRASASVPANIAEGHGREHTKSFVQVLRIAEGSLKEVETHLAIAARVGLVSADQTAPLFLQTDSLGKRVRSLIRSLQEKLERES